MAAGAFKYMPRYHPTGTNLKRCRDVQKRFLQNLKTEVREMSYNHYNPDSFDYRRNIRYEKRRV